MYNLPSKTDTFMHIDSHWILRGPYEVSIMFPIVWMRKQRPGKSKSHRSATPSDLKLFPAHHAVPVTLTTVLRG